MNDAVETPLRIALEGATLGSDLGVTVAADYGDPDGEYRALVDAAAKVDRSARGVVYVTGDDARAFLQSLLSQDLDPLGPGQGAHALLLQPQGKLAADLRVLVRGSDDVVLDCEPGLAPIVVAALERFKIRVDVTLTDCTGEQGIVSVRGPEAAQAVRDALGLRSESDANHSFAAVDDLLIVRADWEGNAGIDLLGPIDTLTEVWNALAVPSAGYAAWNRLRIECGVPREGIDMDDATIPQEALLERDAISFTKGCFLGQELVCRIDSRGHVNRILRRVETEELVPEGTVLLADDREVGRLTSVAATGSGAVGLAIVRREIDPGDEVEAVEPDRRVRATVHAVPGPAHS